VRTIAFPASHLVLLGGIDQAVRANSPGSSLDRAADRAPALVLTAAPTLKLPILAHRRGLLYAIEKFGFTILIGQTGSGKSTQLPQFLHEAGWTADGRQVAICEPRRIAATSLASRVATEAGWVLGEEVGYAIRFEELTSKRTRIKCARPCNASV
jgi:ATP-dependent RNA helicase DDX35